MLFLKKFGATPGKEGPYDTFFAGLLGGYLVFGRRSKRGHVSSVSKQIVIFGKPQVSSLSTSVLLELVADKSLCSLRTSLPLASPTLDPTERRHYQELRALETNITRCMAGLCGTELGFRHVALQMVPRHYPDWIGE